MFCFNNSRLYLIRNDSTDYDSDENSIQIINNFILKKFTSKIDSPKPSL